MDALYWAVITLTTVGYGDIVPVTTEGRVVAMVLVFAGIGVISFATSIVVMAFHEKMRELRDNRVYAAVERQSDITIVCGFGRIGQVVAERLAAAGEDFVIIDKERGQRRTGPRRGYLAWPAIPPTAPCWPTWAWAARPAYPLPDPRRRVQRLHHPHRAPGGARHPHRLPRQQGRDRAQTDAQAGATHVVRPYEVVARMASEFIGQPVAFDALYDVVTRAAGVHLEPLRDPPRRLAGETAHRRNRLHRPAPAAVRRHPAEHVTGADGHARYDMTGRHFYFNPGPDLLLRAGDILMLIGYQASLSRFRDLASSRPPTEGEIMTPRYALFGCNPLAIEVAWRLSMVKLPFILLDRDAALVERAREEGLSAEHIDYTDDDALRAAGIGGHIEVCSACWGRIRKTSSWPFPPAPWPRACASSPSARRRKPPPSCWPPAPTRWWTPTRSAAPGCTN
jgi:voltage-gated potassium channel Kch